MNIVDRSIFDGIAHIRAFPALDVFVRVWNSEEIGFKADLAMAVVWWAWFRPGRPADDDRRSAVLGAIMATAAAVILGRALSHLLPFRMRPFTDPSLHLSFPVGTSSVGLRHWSSFPSDHAMVWGALAAGIGAVSVGAGALLFVVGVVVVCVPRIYVGQHYPTDILAGLAIGALVGWVMTRPRISRVISRPFLEWESKQPAWFYALAFLLTLHLADMFTVLRKLGYTLLHG
ncbi:MAG TPA: phosphatase PAP2 family protein [Polyangia bacterium]|nr:phosphatase PAP2 family protein [Polyangia bacterium]